MISRITENLYIGEYTDVIGQTSEETWQRFEQLRALGINHVLSLCSEGVESGQIVKEFEAFRVSQRGKTTVQLNHKPVPVNIDSVGHDLYKIGFQEALKELSAILFNDPKAKVLIHCTAGIDRASFVVASFLVRCCGFRNLADAYREIKKVRPSVIEHFEWAW